jgi:hypothetical protein
MIRCQAFDLLRDALGEIGALSHELAPARAEELLDEFERVVGGAFLRQDLSAVAATCEGYRRRFRSLAKEARDLRRNPVRRAALSLRMGRRLKQVGQRKATARGKFGAR